jgi:DNA-binding transcriptional LysR family regulator
MVSPTASPLRRASLVSCDPLAYQGGTAMIEIYLLEQLDAFARCGTLSAAAEELHISQPTLSRSMHKLEEELDCPLFIRGKNSIALNETGKYAATYARRILDLNAEMLQQVRSYDRSLHTIRLGSCAPGPEVKILPLLTRCFSEYSVTATLEPDSDVLLAGLRRGDYQFLLLPYPVEEEDLYCQFYVSEHLCANVDRMHPAYGYREVSFQQMDGQNFIMFARVGIWEQLVREKMPHAKFFKQEDVEALTEITASSDLPSFTTDLSLSLVMREPNPERHNIPFSDPEATMMFYLCCRKEDVRRSRRFLKSAAT